MDFADSRVGSTCFVPESRMPMDCTLYISSTCICSVGRKVHAHTCTISKLRITKKIFMHKMASKVPQNQVKKSSRRPDITWVFDQKMNFRFTESAELHEF